MTILLWSLKETYEEALEDALKVGLRLIKK